jgi:trehalose/maltose transport system substrate-binding protein
LSLHHERTAAAWLRARQWIGTLSPPDVTEQLEDDSLRLWKSGNAAFMRNWPYAYVESMRSDSQVSDRIGVTQMPMGDGPNARHADTLGGFQLMVGKETKNREAAIELVRFLTSPEIQRVNAITRGYAPARLDIFDDPAVLKSNTLFKTLHDVLVEDAMIRPSTAAGDQYDAVSAAYFAAARRALTGQESGLKAVMQLDKNLRRILSE